MRQATDLVDISSIEAFARVISPCDWERVPILMLTVCFDAAGKESDESHTVLVVAGFASFSKAWGDFQREWNARLAIDDLTSFHSGDFAQFTGNFKLGWRENESRRRALCGDLMEIIRCNGLRRFGAVIPFEVQRMMDKSLLDEMRIDAYVHGASCAVSSFNKYAGEIGATQNIEYVFEKGDSEDALRKRFREDGYKEPHFTWKQHHTNRKGFTDDGFVGLQAAGWIAYEYYLDSTRLFDTSKAVARRWGLEQFESMLGEITMQVPQTAGNNEGTFRIRKETQYLEEIKRKGKSS